MRYLIAALLGRPRILGRIPWNLLAIAGITAGGFYDPTVWMIGYPAEAAYLTVAAGVMALRGSNEPSGEDRLAVDTRDTRKELLNSLGGAARQRAVRLQEKVDKWERLHREAESSDDLFYDNNREALNKLTWLHIKLLIAQRNLVTMTRQGNDAELGKQIAAIESELSAGGLNETLRESKQATLDILRERRDNLARRDQSLAEIESDLARVEAQVELALENATLKRTPVAISSNIDLVSQLLADRYDPGRTTSLEPPATTTEAAREVER